VLIDKFTCELLTTRVLSTGHRLRDGAKRSCGHLVGYGEASSSTA